MTDKEHMIYQHVIAIRDIMETNPNWSGNLNISHMDKTGSIMIHIRYYDQDKDDPTKNYLSARSVLYVPKTQEKDIIRLLESEEVEE